MLYITKVVQNIIEDTERTQLIWYEYVKQMKEERLPNDVLIQTLRERNKRERPKTTRAERIRKSMNVVRRRSNTEKNI